MDAKASPTSHSYFSQRLRLHYLDWGNAGAPPLLLIHGNRDHCHNWDWVAQRLRDEFHIIAPDLRGHGDSQWTTGSTYSSAEFVYDIAQLVRQTGTAPVAIVAHSLGGRVALQYAGAFPDQVSKLVVIEGYGQRTPVPDASPVGRVRDWVTSGRRLAGHGPRRYATLEDAYQRMHEANRHLSAAQARHLTIHGSNQNEDGTYSWKFDPYTRQGAAFDLSMEDLHQFWRQITCPVLLISGSESWVRRDGDAEALVKPFRDARHEVVDHAGHWVQHDQLEVFLDLVHGFLSG